MKKILLFLFSFFFIANAEAKITIVACEPEWRSLASEIVKDKATTIMVTLPNQNPATLPVTRGLGNIFRTADMVFCSGNGLEEKWLERIINSGDVLSVITNKENLLLAADYATYKPSSYGANAPRVHLNPHNILPIATEFTRRVKLADPLNANFYQRSYEEFSVKWNKSIRFGKKQRNH